MEEEGYGYDELANQQHVQELVQEYSVVEEHPCAESIPNTAESCGNIIPDATLAAIVANQTLLHKNQLKIMTSLAQIITSFDILNKKVFVIEKNVKAETKPAENVFRPVTTVNDLVRLEEELKSDTKMQQYVRQLSSVCGTSGKSDGVTSAYKLIDYMATREFMNMCSWTGLTRDNTEPPAGEAQGAVEVNLGKIPLKFYSKFRELFFKVIQLADKDFAESTSDKFFKGIMKNSKQRLTSKVTSTHKNRPKKLQYGPNQNNENTPIE